MPKNVRTTALTIALISQASKVMLKILQARLQQHVNHGIPDVQTGFRKGRGTREHLLDHRKSRRIPEKASALLTMPKPLTVWITTNCGKLFKRLENSSRDGNTRSPDLPPAKPACRSRKQQLEPDMKQQTGSK